MKTQDRSKIVASLAEQSPGERRVALVPSDVAKLAKKVQVLIEAGAGASAGFSDTAYREAGAEVTDRDGALQAAGTVVVVRPPSLKAFRPETTLISLGAHDVKLQSELAAKRILHLGLERMPRTSKAQSMDVLSSQAAIAGYASVMEGARALDVLLPMMTTAAGGIKPAKMIALGAGVAGLQAIATARRLGAIAHGFDVRKAAGEQIESLGAKFVFPDFELPAPEASGGYAAAQSHEQQSRLRRALTPHLAEMNLVVASAQIPGRPAPVLIDDETLAAMKPGAVIVDLAAETGGNTSRTKPNELVEASGVRILGPTNLPSLFATDASRLFSGNMRSLLEHLVHEEDGVQISLGDSITAAMLSAAAPALASA
ncbi:NAD(P) transhydrogenase subunit alpha [Mesorhizobium sp. VK23B]|uniref:proton-translocating NAD(P)(+) transhydrogenase n=1 Tax=Mesorhizobium dulcispinae TaxID=3072316 RepID=A0ABU4XPH2_9HYPH|nr:MULTISPECIES: NAD(P) transhydrogenase subunit alpha [unclassified Mesorhizobium]MDX8470290.1 NAD(P) transhydrogenase subunit alpha [Mesorhizobium sp. VK23B]MDX8476655.1 NAD(P) transhydrogenase subunit alpha [Mesorhizobium sp. VK23A]